MPNSPVSLKGPRSSSPPDARNRVVLPKEIFDERIDGHGVTDIHFVDYDPDLELLVCWVNTSQRPEEESVKDLKNLVKKMKGTALFKKLREKWRKYMGMK